MISYLPDVHNFTFLKNKMNSNIKINIFHYLPIRIYLFYCIYVFYCISSTVSTMYVIS